MIASAYTIWQSRPTAFAYWLIAYGHAVYARKTHKLATG
ncbi:GCN5-like N-acetyltransferase [Alicyclobacillus hesperidum URH17-3-68]|nr:GCN5-like N-acetyltransferase [Alicyclobacillus hesperidum URH17-3-68]